MKKTLIIQLLLLILPLELSANYKIIAGNNNLKLPEKTFFVETCKSLEPNQPSGFYTFEANDKTYETYCYNNNGEFWTLIGYYNYLSNFQPKPNLSTLNTEGYLSREIWDIIQPKMNDLIFAGLYPDSSRAAQLDLNSLTNANCHSFDYFDTRITPKERIFHSENMDCLVMGTDYTIIDLNHSYTPNNVGFWNYSDSAQIQEIGYFFTGESGFQEVQHYNSVYFFIK